MHSMLHAIVHPSVCLSILSCLDQSNVVECWIMQFSTFAIPVVFAGKLHVEILTGPLRPGASIKEWVGKIRAIF